MVGSLINIYWVNERMNKPRSGSFFFFFSFRGIMSWPYSKRKYLFCLWKLLAAKGFEIPSPNRWPIHLILGSLKIPFRLFRGTLFLQWPCFGSLFLVQIPMWRPRIFQIDTVPGSIGTFCFKSFIRKPPKLTKKLVSFKLRRDVLLWIVRSFYSSTFPSVRILLYWDNSASGLG